MAAIIVVGSINVDMTTYLDRWPQKGETIKANSVSINTGGKGANQACAAARLGVSSIFIGATGNDGYAQNALDDLKELGAECLTLSNPTVPTGMAFIDIGPDRNNIIRLAEGANGELTSTDIETTWTSAHPECDVLLLQNEIPIKASLAACALAKAAGALTIMDPAPAPPEMWNKEIFAQFDLITPNEKEAAQITGLEINNLEDAKSAALILSEMTGRGAIITMGGAGVVWVFDGKQGAMEAPKVNVIDTVAAGDCFNGALAAGLASGKSFEDAIYFASHAASLATTKKGALPSLPSLAEVMDFINSRSA